jgi:hypothetical protein
MGANSITQPEPGSLRDRRDIDEQVERILNHPLFNQSKRLPVFLRYIVMESQRPGAEGGIKERTIGVEVFGRKPDYDNNTDPIVRVTATELRKKLAQYYYQDGHDDELRIELPPGSYLPKFRDSSTESATAPPIPQVFPSESNPPPLETEEPAVAPTTVDIPITSSLTPQSKSLLLGWKLLGLLLVVNIVVVALLGFSYWSHKYSPLDRFWSQLASNPGRVLIVMPVIGSDNTKGAEADLRSVSVRPNLSLEDTNIAVRIAGQLERHDAHYQLVSSAEVTFDEMRTGPAILIGALDNIWTTRLMQKLPFVFEEAPDHRTGRIVDTGSNGSRTWTVDIDMPHTRITHDYGIVARYTNQITGEPVVVIAGISSQGTQSAGELLSSKEFEAIRDIAMHARNFEIVIDTEAIEGQAGRPQIVASKTW